VSARCIGEPVSWLRLERYHLGEVDAEERARVAEHLSACPACAACFAQIGADEENALRPLDLPAVRPRRVRSARATFARRAAGVVGVVSMAAAVMLAVGRGFGPGGGGIDPAGGNYAKGGAVTFSLVRDDSESIVAANGIFHDGDRFKAVVTCPPSLRATFDVVVFDASGPSFPLVPTVALTCGNSVPLSGAFRLTGLGEETVCVVWAEAGAPDRAVLSQGERTLGERSACKHLQPAVSP
jgi:hypothetical protein